MKVKQFRDVLEKAAMMHVRLGAGQTASALRALACALEAHDKVTVQKLWRT